MILGDLVPGVLVALSGWLSDRSLSTGPIGLLHRLDQVMIAVSQVSMEPAPEDRLLPVGSFGPSGSRSAAARSAWK